MPRSLHSTINAATGEVGDRYSSVQELDGITHARYHARRHAFARVLIAGGGSVEAVRRTLGQALAATTLNLYAHRWPGDDDRIRQAVERSFGPTVVDRLRTEDEAR